MKKEFLRDAIKFNSIKDIIYNSVKLYPGHIAFVTKIIKNKTVEYKNTTYKKLLDEINALGTALYGLGLKGKRIAICGRNRYEWALAHLSCLLGGMVSVPLDKDLQVNELEDSLIRSKAEAIVFDSKFEEKIKTIKERGNTIIKQYICMDELVDYISLQNLLNKGKEVIKSGNREFIEHEVDPYSMSILLFTSGTTSKSKAVMLNQNGIAVNVYNMQLVEDIRDTDTNIAFLPFHHIFGSTAMIVMLACGVKTVFPDGLRYIQANLKEYKVTVFVGVPLLVDKMYENIEKEIARQNKTKIINIAKKASNGLLKLNIDIRRKIFKQVIDGLGGEMRFVISGGAPLDKKTAKGFNELGIKLVQGYGLTETSPVIAAETFNKSKYGSVGVPMKDMQVEIVNKDAEGIGEIRVKGPNVMLGYYENEEATNAVLKDGWFYTGDLGYIDKDGFIFITGRRKDMIVLKNGKKVFPEEIETLVNRLPEVEECFVFGMPEEDDKSKIKIAIKVVYNKEYSESQKMTEDELKKEIWNKIKEINKTFPPYKYIKHMILTDKPLIKTTTHKIKRNEELKTVLN